MDRPSRMISSFWTSALLQALKLSPTDARASKGARRVVAVSYGKSAAAGNWHLDGLQGPLFMCDTDWATGLPIVDDFARILTTESHRVIKGQRRIKFSQVGHLILALIVFAFLFGWLAMLPVVVNGVVIQ